MAVSITQTDNPNGVAASSTVATYSGVSIGTAAANRIVAVVVGTELSSSTPSACTIDYGSGDTAMTAATGGNFGAVYSQIYYLAVPTGTTATIKVTFSATSPASTANHIAVYRVVGAKTTLSAQGGDGSSDMDSTDPLTTGSTTIPTDGAFLAIAAGATDGTAKTWANATEDLDVDAGGFRFTTAMHHTAGTATRTCTGTSNGEDGALSYVIFSPDLPPSVTLDSPVDTNTYYFNASDGGPTDPDGAWNNDANGFDGSTATNTSTASTGSSSSLYIMAEGTTAPTSGDAILRVRARFRSENSSQIDGEIYTDGLTESLGGLEATSGVAYSNYTTLSTPSGGWTWQKINDLEVKMWKSAGGTTAGFSIVEIEVLSAPTFSDTTPTLEFTGTDAEGSDIRYHIQIDTVNTFDSQA